MSIPKNHVKSDAYSGILIFIMVLYTIFFVLATENTKILSSKYMKKGFYSLNINVRAKTVMV